MIKKNIEGNTKFLTVPSALHPKNVPATTMRTQDVVHSPAEISKQNFDEKAQQLKILESLPGPNLTKALEIAKRKLSELLSDQLHINLEKIDVIFLETGEYEQNLGYMSDGRSIAGQDVVYVRLEKNKFDFELLATCIHELIHKSLQLSVITVSENQQTNGQSREIKSIANRIGLAVIKVIRDSMTGQDKNFHSTGNFLNELATIALQIDLFKKLEADQELHEFFSAERAKMSSFSLSTLYLEQPLSSIYINPAFAIYRKDGDLADASYWRQFIENLSALYDQPNYSLVDDLTKATIDPSYQSVLKQRLELIFSKGYYRKLKSALVSADNLLSLLKYTQDKLGISPPKLQRPSPPSRKPLLHTFEQNQVSRSEEAPVYENKNPYFEVWDFPSEQPQTVLVYQTQGERYVLKEGSSLEVIKDGMSLPLTPDRVRSFTTAVQNSNKPDLIEFLKRNSK
jgi:hypothetical protein